MSEQTPPYPYYNGIIYNSALFGSASGDYLPRTGVATSVATSTTFNGIVYTNGLTNTGTLSTTNISVSGTVSLPSASIADSALSTNIPLKNGTQTFSGTNTFSNPPVMSGASISATSIPDSALSTNVALLSGTQTFSGAKTFSTAPVMSGASISATSIPDSALSTNVALLTGTQTFSGTKTFSTAPVMSGASITSGTIPITSVSGTAVNLSSTQTISGDKTFTGAVNITTGSGVSPFTINTAGVVACNMTATQPTANVAMVNFVNNHPTNQDATMVLQYNNGAGTAGGVKTTYKQNTSSPYGVICLSNTSGNNNSFAFDLNGFCLGRSVSTGLPNSATYKLDINGSLLVGTGLTLTSGTMTLPSASISDSALSTNVALLNGTQTFSGTNTFSVAPVMSGASISATSIPDSALSTNVALLSGTQTFSGAKSFSSTTTMTGDVITNNITVNNDFKVGLYNPTQYFSGSYSYSTTTNPLSATATTNFTYLLGTTSNTLVYTGARTLTLNYVVISGGGNGGGGSSNVAGLAGGGGGGGGAGQFLSGTTTISTGQSIVLVVGSAGQVSSLTINSVLIASAVAGNDGATRVMGTSGQFGGSGAGGTPAGGAGAGFGNIGAVGTANSVSASGAGGNGGTQTSTANTGGVFSNLMNDLTTTVNICKGGDGGRPNLNGATVNTSYYGSGGNGGGGSPSSTLYLGSAGVQGAIMLFFNTNIFEATTSGIRTLLPITPIYSSLPTYTSNQIGYSVRNTLTSATLTSSWVSPTGGQILLPSVGVYLLTYAFSSKNVGAVLMGCLTLSSTAPYSSPQTTNPDANTFAFSGSTPQNANWTSATNTYVFNNTSPNTTVYFYWSSSGSAIPPSTGNYFQAVRLA